MNKTILILLIMNIFSCSTKVTTKPNTVVVNENVFTAKSSLTWVKKAVNCSNALINDVGFINELRTKNNFTYTNDSGVMVYKKMVSHRCVVRTYRTRNPFSKVLATTYTNNDVDLYLNRRKKRDVYNWTGTNHHECSHNYGYSHGSNKKTENWEKKKDSVPYWLGALATKHAKRVCK